jgi:imipenem/basic amino acid-specific outer membrane pore
MNRDFRNGASNGASTSANPAGYREETGLGIRLLFESGFTQGTVGVGVDAHSLSSIKIDGGRGRYGTGQFDQTSDGRGDDTQTEVGGAIKFRISDTVLKYGNQFVASPVFSTDDSRILPEVATGTYLVSNEIEGLELSAGRFTGMSSQVSTDRDTFEIESANIVGASYAFTEKFSGAIHAADVEDYWKKYYGNLNYTLPLAEEQALNFDFNIYKTDYEKSYIEAATADLDNGIPGVRESRDNTIWSLATAYSIGAHKFTLAYQRSSGDRGYDYVVDGGGTVWLNNSVQFSDFNGEDEKSWQGRYDLDMTSYGVPGLSFMTRYIYGDDITTSSGEEGKEHEWNFETKYVIQEGAAKDLSFRLRHAIWRANDAYNADYSADLNDTRLIVEYPLDVL